MFHIRLNLVQYKGILDVITNDSEVVGQYIDTKYIDTSPNSQIYFDWYYFLINSKLGSSLREGWFYHIFLK